MPNPIVVGLDGSQRQQAVFDTAVALADETGAPVHLCRAVTVPVSIPAAAWTMQGDELADYLVSHAREELQTLVARLPEGAQGPVHVKLGQPAEVLCDVAREVDAQTLVIGSHGYGTVERLLGTTASKVVNYAPCNVLVVRPTAG